LDVVVEGGDRSANVNTDLTLTNAGTYNPDDPEDTDFECSWTCEDWTNINVNNPYYSRSIGEYEWNEVDDDEAATYLGYQHGNCRTQSGGTLTNLQSQGSDLTILAGTIPEGAFYYFKSSCSKNGIESSGYQWIKGI